MKVTQSNAKGHPLKVKIPGSRKLQQDPGQDLFILQTYSYTSP